MNVPNTLSLSRIGLLFIITVLLLLPFTGSVIIAFVLFNIAALTDWADGWLARRTGAITRFGKLMDALADKVLMVGVFVVLISLPDFMPWWSVFLVLIIVCREFLVTGLRMVAASSGVVLAAEKGGKIKTVFQISAASVLMAALAILRDGGNHGAVFEWFFWIGMLLFIVATWLTIQSGVTYMTKYWYMFKEDAS